MKMARQVGQRHAPRRPRRPIGCMPTPSFGHCHPVGACSITTVVAFVPTATGGGRRVPWPQRSGAAGAQRDWGCGDCLPGEQDRRRGGPRRWRFTRYASCVALWFNASRTERTLTSDARRDAIAETGSAIDAAALDAFVREHHGRLVGLARLVCRDSSEATDVVQLALEQAWRRRDSLRDAQALRPWLDRIVVREAIRMDRRRRSPLARFFDGPREIPVDTIEPGTAAPHTSLALRLAFEGLPANQRAAVALHVHYGYTVAETARLVDAPVETVRSRIRTGRDALRHALEDERR
jgi:RNA polymerase sigma factor (sigma-70 family)